MKRFQEYTIHAKIVIILIGILLVNLCCLSVLYFMQEREARISRLLLNSSKPVSYSYEEIKPRFLYASVHEDSKAQLMELFLAQQLKTDQNKKYLIFFFLLSSSASCGICYLAMKKHVVQPVLTILDKSTDLALGNIPALAEKKSEDELGQITTSINTIIQNKNDLSDFVKKIGNGEPDAHYQLLSEKDVIGQSLISMREKMQKISQEEAKRNWANEGVAIFSDMLMEESSLKILSEKLLTGLVKYVAASQGALFIKENGEEDEPVFEMYACYAWSRKKFLNKKIKLNEGLIGQAAIEKETIFLTEVPDDYVKITSGMGEANPNSILIVPLKVNEAVHGVLELASFKVFERYEIDFIQKLAENIASTISNVKINENTKRLLEESRAMNENLQAQEEELRQNAEELNATQESLERAKEEMRIQIEQLQSEKIKNEGILEGCVDAIISFNEFGKIEFYNQASQEIWGISKDKAMKKNIKDFLPVEIGNDGNGKTVYYVNKQQKEKLTARTEIHIQLHSNETPVLITVSRVQTGENYFFTAFIQNIAVELF